MQEFDSYIMRHSWDNILKALPLLRLTSIKGIDSFGGHNSCQQDNIDSRLTATS